MVSRCVPAGHGTTGRRRAARAAPDASVPSEGAAGVREAGAIRRGSSRRLANGEGAHLGGRRGFVNCGGDGPGTRAIVSYPAAAGLRPVRCAERRQSIVHRMPCRPAAPSSRGLSAVRPARHRRCDLWCLPARTPKFDATRAAFRYGFPVDRPACTVQSMAIASPRREWFAAELAAAGPTQSDLYDCRAVVDRSPGAAWLQPGTRAGAAAGTPTPRLPLFVDGVACARDTAPQTAPCPGRTGCATYAMRSIAPLIRGPLCNGCGRRDDDGCDPTSWRAR